MDTPCAARSQRTKAEDLQIIKQLAPVRCENTTDGSAWWASRCRPPTCLTPDGALFRPPSRSSPTTNASRLTPQLEPVGEPLVT